MAEKLLGALARGTYKAATDPIKSAAKQAFDPNIMRTVYRAGIIGPLVKSIVSEYKRGDDKKEKQTPVVKDVSRSLQSLNSQISSLASIMEDVRDLTQNQLQLQKDIFAKTQRDARKADLEAVEEKIERPAKQGFSGFMEAAADKVQKAGGGGLLGDFGSGILRFVGRNPILSFLIAGTAIAQSEKAQEIINGVIKGAKLDEGVAKVRDTVGNIISNQVGLIMKQVGIVTDKTTNDLITSGAIGGILGRKLLGKGGGIPGIVAGLALSLTKQNNMQAQLPADASPIERLLSNLGLNAETLGTLGAAGAAMWGGKKLLGGMRAPKPITPTTPPIVTPQSTVPSTVAPGGKLTPLQRSKTFQYGNIGAQPTAAQPSVATKTLSVASKATKAVGAGSLIAAALSSIGSIIEGDYTGALISGGSTLVGAALGSLLGPIGTGIGAFGGSMLGEYINRQRAASRSSVMEGYTDSRIQGAPVGGTQEQTGEFDLEKYKQLVSQRESSNDYSADNKLGFLGKYQFGAQALETFGFLKKGTSADRTAVYNPSNWTGKEGIKNAQDFLNSPAVQEKLMDQFTSANLAGLNRAGVTIAGMASEDLASRLYAAHHGGVGGATKYFKQGIDTPDFAFSNSSVARSAASMKQAYSGSVGTLTANTTQPAYDPREQIEMIQQLRAFEKWATGNVTVVDQSQTTMGAGSGEVKRSQPPAIEPFSRSMENERSLFFGSNFPNMRWS